MQHREGVARAVAGGEDDVLGVDLLRCSPVARRIARRDASTTTPRTAPPSMRRSTTRAPKRTSPPSRSISCAHPLDHADQAEGADVRLGDVADLLGRAGADELVDHLARQVARVADLAPELAVGEGAGAALAELHVRFRIEDAAPPQAPGVLACARARPCRARGRSAAGPSAPAAARQKMPHGPKPTTTGRGAAAGGEVGRRLGDRGGSAVSGAGRTCGSPAMAREHRRLVARRRSRPCRRRRSPPCLRAS